MTREAMLPKPPRLVKVPAAARRATRASPRNRDYISPHFGVALDYKILPMRRLSATHRPSRAGRACHIASILARQMSLRQPDDLCLPHFSRFRVFLPESCISGPKACY